MMTESKIQYEERMQELPFRYPEERYQLSTPNAELKKWRSEWMGRIYTKPGQGDTRDVLAERFNKKRAEEQRKDIAEAERFKKKQEDEARRENEKKA